MIDSRFFHWLESLMPKVFGKPVMIQEVIQRSAKIVTINIIGALLVFLTNYGIVRFFGEQNYGSYVLVNIWVSILSVIVLFGMDDLLVAEIPKLKARSDGSTASLVLWGALVLFISLLAVILVFSIILQLDLLPPVLKEYRLEIFALVALTAAALFLNALLRGFNKIEYGQVVDKCFKPLLFAAMVLLLYSIYENRSVDLLLWCAALSLLAVVLAFILKTKTVIPQREYTGSRRRNLIPNLSFLGISLLYLLSNRMDIIFLSYNVPLEEVGHYNIAARLSDLVAYPLTALNLLVPTMIANALVDEESNVHSKVRKMMKLGFFFMLFGFVLVVLAGRPLLSFFGTNFTGSYEPLIILACGHLFAALAAPLNGYFMVSGRQLYSLYALSIGLITTFCLGLLLVPGFKANGAAFSVLGGGFVYLCSLAMFYRRQFRRSLPGYGQ